MDHKDREVEIIPHLLMPLPSLPLFQQAASKSGLNTQGPLPLFHSLLHHGNLVSSLAPEKTCLEQISSYLQVAQIFSLHLIEFLCLVSNLWWLNAARNPLLSIPSPLLSFPTPLPAPKWSFVELCIWPLALFSSVLTFRVSVIVPAPPFCCWVTSPAKALPCYPSYPLGVEPCSFHVPFIPRKSAFPPAGSVIGSSNPGDSSGKEPTCQCRTHETRVQSLGWKDPLEKGMASLSNILAWRIPWAEKPGGLQSVRLQRVGRDWAPLKKNKKNL